MATESLPPKIARDAAVSMRNTGTALRKLISHVKFVQRGPSRKSIGDSLVSPDISRRRNTEESYSDYSDQTRQEVESMSTSQESLKEAEHVLFRQLEYLRIMAIECKEETWLSPELIASLNDLYQILQEIVQIISSMRLAVEDGFLERLSLNILHPLMVHLDDVGQKISAGVDLCAEHLEEAFSGRGEPLTQAKWYRDVKKSGKALFNEYELLVEGLEKSHKLTASPTPDVIRMSFIIYSLGTFYKSLNVLWKKVDRVHVLAKQDASWGFWRSRVSILVKPLHMLIGFFYSCIQLALPCVFGPSDFVSRLDEWRASGAWRFCMRFSLGLCAVSFISVGIDTVSPVEFRNLWLCATTIFVSVPTVGASIRKSMHRLVGTVLAAATAQGVRFAIAAVGGSPPLRIPAALLTLASVLIFVFITTYTQHSSKYPKPYQWVVAAFTFQIVLMVGYPYSSAVTEWWVGLQRIGQVIVGDLLGCCVAALIFPQTSFGVYKHILEDVFIKIPEPFTALDSEDAATTFAKCTETLLTLSKAPRLSKESLKEMKSEFKASCRASMIPSWQRVHDLLGPTSAWMTAMVRILVYHQRSASKLDKSLLHSIYPIIYHNVIVLQHDVSVVNQFLGNRVQTSFLAPSRYEHSFSRLHTIHQRQREHLIRGKTLHQNLRSLLHLDALLYSNQMFYQSWNDLVGALPAEIFSAELEDVIAEESTEDSPSRD
eukprot:TRINITY_DN1446_c0_g1_i1.p1 TRINITY_DN1446_c0_g1~~TRINITY_DN1446_c0_g1_i1.p1  ORF type:complete len:714 (-),score=66.39 TRINITY_DN1446_c0_g1_i1:1419-3560(-)